MSRALESQYKAFEEEVIRFKREASLAGVEPQHLDAVAAVAMLMSKGAQQHVTAQLERTHNNTEPEPPFAETIVDWADNLRLESHVDRFVAATIYLWEREAKRTVDSSDIIRIYTKARWEKPRNPSDVFYRAAKQKFFAEADNIDGGDDGRKKWQLTRTGYSYYQSLQKENNRDR